MSVVSMMISVDYCISLFFSTKFKRIISEQANSLKGRAYVHHVVPQ